MITLSQTDTAPAELLFGTLKSAAANAQTNFAAGIRLVTVPIRWRLFEPQPGVFDAAYIEEMRRLLWFYRDNGLRILLDLSMHHPPDWVWEIADSRFINQYGDGWQPREEGQPAVNGVFNQRVREHQEAYAAQVFRELGTDFFALRLGWLAYGELHYPFSHYNGRSNCYWCFDANAQGQAGNLPSGTRACPVLGWTPGTTGPGRAAAEFIEWYLESLQAYHDWQIRTARRYFPGPLAMMYASWGIRPGDIERAVQGNLSGATLAERPFQCSPHGGQIQLGYDVARFVAGITDPDVLVYSTTLAALPVDRSIDDTDEDPTRWSPMHYLHHLVQQNPLGLSLFGENAGNGNVETMRRCFERMMKYGLIGMVWAFESQLYDPEEKYASIGQYAELIGAHAGVRRAALRLRSAF